MSIEQTLATLHSLFQTACLELFEGLGCRIDLGDEAIEVPEGTPMAYIDAGSDDLELALILCVPLPVLALTYPSQGSITEVDEAKLEDWITELANQLIGRFKNKLLNYQCVLKLGLPTAYFGAELSELLQPEYQHRIFPFQADQEAFSICLSLDILNDNLTLNEPSEADQGAGEGELELF